MVSFDLSKSIKSKTITMKKNSTGTVEFKKDISGQVVMSESGGNIVFTVYKTQKTTYKYTKIVELYEAHDERYKVTTTKYVYAKNANNDEWSWQVSGKTSTRIISASEKPAEITGDNKYMIAYTMQSSGTSSTNSSNFYVAETADEKDAVYQNKIDKYGTTSKSLTGTVMAKITINAASATGLKLITEKNDNYENVLEETFVAVHKDNNFTGTYLNEVATSSDASETFSLKKGNDTINYSFLNGRAKVGSDTINLVKGEMLTLNLLNSTKNTTDVPDVNADMYVNTSYTKKDNDLIMKFTNEYGASLGKTTIKNYFKIAKDNVFLTYSGSNSATVDQTQSLKSVLAYENGIGRLGNDSSKKAQTVTGNFVDNTINTGSGKDTIKGVAGNNLITAGQNDDTIYSGSGQDSFFVYTGDATGSKGDVIYNADMNDSLYFLDPASGAMNPVDFDTNFNFTKKGNSLVVNYNAEGVNNPAATNPNEKVTFSDYFKKNSALFNINDAEDYSGIVINQTGKDTIKGTDYKDNITLTGKSTVYTGAGDDLVKFYYQTGNATAGYTTKTVTQAVTAYVDGVGDKTFSRSEGDEKGKGADMGTMGNKTIVFKTAGVDTDEVNLNLGVDITKEHEGYIYTKSGNNLKVEGYYDMNGAYNPLESQDYGSYGSYTVQNYFKSDFDYAGTINLDGAELNLAGGVVYQFGAKNKENKLYDSAYGDYILGNNKNDKYYFTLGGNDRAYDVKGNDTYNVSSLANGLTIEDKAGKDTLIISDTNAHSLYFDITLDGTNLSAVGKDLQIFDKTKMQERAIVGGVTVKDYIADYTAGGTVAKGAGCIETIKANGQALSVDVDKIAGSVAGWLADKGYSSSAAVFADTENPGNLDTMLAIYTTGLVPNP